MNSNKNALPKEIQANKQNIFTITEIQKKTGNLTKNISKQINGKLHKDASLKQMEFHGLPEYFKNASSDSTIIHGIPKESSNAGNMNNFTIQSLKNLDPGQGNIPRTKNDFEYPKDTASFTLIDYDHDRGQNYEGRSFKEFYRTALEKKDKFVSWELQLPISTI